MAKREEDEIFWRSLDSGMPVKTIALSASTMRQLMVMNIELYNQSADKIRATQFGFQVNLHTQEEEVVTIKVNEDGVRFYPNLRAGWVVFGLPLIWDPAMIPEAMRGWPDSIYAHRPGFRATLG